VGAVGGAPATVTFDEEEPSPSPVKAVAVAPPQASVSPRPAAGGEQSPGLDLAARVALKYKVKAALGSAAQDVELQFDGRDGVKILVKTQSGADIDRLAVQIMQVPELSKYRISMDFK
jgi:hypothetical protein